MGNAASPKDVYCPGHFALKSMDDLREMISNKDMSFFIEAKWSEKGINKIGYLTKNDAKDFLESVFRYAAQDESLVIPSSLIT